MINKIFLTFLLFMGSIPLLFAQDSKKSENDYLYNIADNAYETLIKVPQLGVKSNEAKIINIIETGKKLLNSKNINEFSLGILLHNAVTHTLITMFAYEIEYQNWKEWPQKSDCPRKGQREWPHCFSDIPLNKNTFIKLWKLNQLDETDILKRVLEFDGKSSLGQKVKKYNGIDKDNSNINSTNFSIPLKITILVNKLGYINMLDLTKPDLLLLKTLFCLQLGRDNEVLIKLYEEGVKIPIDKVKLRKLYESNIKNNIRLDTDEKQPFKFHLWRYQYVFEYLRRYKALDLILGCMFYDILKDKKVFKNKFIEKRRKHFKVIENVSQLEKM